MMGVLRACLDELSPKQDNEAMLKYPRQMILRRVKNIRDYWYHMDISVVSQPLTKSKVELITFRYKFVRI